jgi:hypothetical protein
MAKTTGTYRQIISIPMDLKRRMDKVADQANWSAVAAQAFEIKLGEIAATKEKMNMNDVIQRLRALNFGETSQVYKTGQEVGQEWAKENAGPSELRRLDEWKASMDAEGMFCKSPTSPFIAAYSMADALYFSMSPENDNDRDASHEFWESVGASNDQQSDSDFIEGFCEGARDIWIAVKDKI